MNELEELEIDLRRYPLNSIERVLALNRLVELLHVWDSKRALKYATEALDISERLSFRSGIATSLSLCALCHMYHGDNKRALEEAQTALRLFENDEDCSNQAAVLTTIGTIHSHLGDYEPALEYLTRAAELEKDSDTKDNAARAYQNIGSIYHKFADYAQALHFHLQCLELSEFSKNERIESLALSSLGEVYFDLGEYSTSIAYYQRSLNIYQHISDRWGEAFALEKMGLICAKMGGLEDSLVFHKRSMVLRKENQDKRGQASSLYFIGEILNAQNFDSQALAIYKESLDLRIQTDDKLGMAETYLGIASVHIKENSPVHNNIVANDLLVKCLRIAASIKVRNLEMRAHGLLASSHKQIQMYSKALEHMERCLALREEIGGDDVGLRVKQLEIALIKEKSEREVERNRLENVELAGALKKVEALNQHLSDLNHEKNDFLSIVSHDLKNPIAGILLITSTLERYHLRMTPEEVLKNVRAIADTATRTRDIVTKLLDINRIESGQMGMNLEKVNLTLIADMAINDSKMKAVSKSLRVSFVHQDTDSFVEADPNSLRECIENYLSNALKYSPLGKQICVRIVDSEKSGYTRFEIEDEGAGISAEDQQKLFSRYSKVGTKTTGGEDSSGLGLNSVKKFIEMMNGSVGCTSIVGKGSIFYFDLQSAESPTSRPTTASTHDRQQASRLQ